MGGRNKEGYADPTACEAVGRVFREEKKRPKAMCRSCKHQRYCEKAHKKAYKKDSCCGNHTEKGGSPS